MSLTYYTTCGL